MAAAAAPARPVSLPPPAACLCHPSSPGSEPADSVPLEGSAELPANSVLASSAATDGPDSTGAAARCSVAQCFAAL